MFFRKKSKKGGTDKAGSLFIQSERFPVETVLEGTDAIDFGVDDENQLIQDIKQNLLEKQDEPGALRLLAQLESNIRQPESKPEPEVVNEDIVQSAPLDFGAHQEADPVFSESVQIAEEDLIRPTVVEFAEASPDGEQVEPVLEVVMPQMAEPTEKEEEPVVENPPQSLPELPSIMISNMPIQPEELDGEPSPEITLPQPEFEAMEATETTIATEAEPAEPVVMESKPKATPIWEHFKNIVPFGRKQPKRISVDALLEAETNAPLEPVSSEHTEWAKPGSSKTSPIPEEEHWILEQLEPELPLSSEPEHWILEQVEAQVVQPEASSELESDLESAPEPDLPDITIEAVSPVEPESGEVQSQSVEIYQSEVALAEISDETLEQSASEWPPVEAEIAPEIIEAASISVDLDLAQAEPVDEAQAIEVASIGPEFESGQQEADVLDLDAFSLEASAPAFGLEEEEEADESPLGLSAAEPVTILDTQSVRSLSEEIATGEVDMASLEATLVSTGPEAATEVTTTLGETLDSEEVFLNTTAESQIMSSDTAVLLPEAPLDGDTDVQWSTSQPNEPEVDPHELPTAETPIEVYKPEPVATVEEMPQLWEEPSVEEPAPSEEEENLLLAPPIRQTPGTEAAFEDFLKSVLEGARNEANYAARMDNRLLELSDMNLLAQPPVEDEPEISVFTAKTESARLVVEDIAEIPVASEPEPLEALEATEPITAGVEPDQPETLIMGPEAVETLGPEMLPVEEPVLEPAIQAEKFVTVPAQPYQIPSTALEPTFLEAVAATLAEPVIEPPRLIALAPDFLESMAASASMPEALPAISAPLSSDFLEAVSASLVFQPELPLPKSQPVVLDVGFLEHVAASLEKPAEVALLELPEEIILEPLVTQPEKPRFYEFTRLVVQNPHVLKPFYPGERRQKDRVPAAIAQPVQPVPVASVAVTPTQVSRMAIPLGPLPGDPAPVHSVQPVAHKASQGKVVSLFSAPSGGSGVTPLSGTKTLPHESLVQAVETTAPDFVESIEFSETFDLDLSDTPDWLEGLPTLAEIAPVTIAETHVTPEPVVPEMAPNQVSVSSGSGMQFSSFQFDDHAAPVMPVEPLMLSQPEYPPAAAGQTQEPVLSNIPAEEPASTDTLEIPGLSFEFNDTPELELNAETDSPDLSIGSAVDEDVPPWMLMGSEQHEGLTHLDEASLEMDGIQILASGMLMEEFKILLVHYNDVYALMVDNGEDSALLKTFETNPLEESPHFVVNQEAVMGTKVMYIVQVGSWQGIVSLESDEAKLQAEL